jgi:hypothetical protein
VRGHNELHLFILSQVTANNYISLSSHKSHHKELHLFVLSQVTSQRTTSHCSLTSHITKNYISLSSHKSHHKELYLFVLSQVTKNYISLSSHKSHQWTTSLCPLTSHITNNYIKKNVRGQRDVVMCDMTCGRTKRGSSFWCDLWVKVITNRGQRDTVLFDVVICDMTCERTKRCSSLMWLVRG